MSAEIPRAADIKLRTCLRGANEAVTETMEGIDCLCAAAVALLRSRLALEALAVGSESSQPTAGCPNLLNPASQMPSTFSG